MSLVTEAIERRWSGRRAKGTAPVRGLHHDGARGGDGRRGRRVGGARRRREGGEDDEQRGEEEAPHRSLSRWPTVSAWASRSGLSSSSRSTLMPVRSAMPDGVSPARTL